MTEREPWGPWRLAIGDPERAPQFRSMAAMAKLLLWDGPDRDRVVLALLEAETSDEGARRALELLGPVPTRVKRQILATFGALTYELAPLRSASSAAAPNAA